MPGSIWDATRILFREGTLPQGNTRAMNWRICWRWNVVGGPGHDDACLSSAVRDFFSPSCFRAFVWTHPSVTKLYRDRLARRHEDTKEEAEVCPLFDCFSDRSSRRRNPQMALIYAD